ncbi:acetylxylan esterase [Streptosporangium amethystogenes]|uniref:acetylxylan esterase n=1 Tax=Streptosporangium amethystogenes TaxID=2002 RepID=UPI0004C98E58|nr:acetylxylan esterase [Streptosporangium amethystogenes]
MPLFDLPLDQLRSYRPDTPEPADFDDFWTQTLAEARKFDLDLGVVPVDTGLTMIDSFDVSYAGYGGTPVRAWLHLPVDRTGPLPAVVEYIGYNGGRGLAHERILWAAAGYAHLVMDTRGQGAAGSSKGDTPDLEAAGDPAHPGVMTRGILSPETYYYRRVFTDAVRAVDTVRSLPDVDARKVAVTGGSQGGGITLAVAGLVEGLAAVMADVPFLCDFPRAVTITDVAPYVEIVNYVKTHRDKLDTAMSTLGYFDGAAHARRATAPALFSVALMDRVCPPSTVYAAFNQYGGPRQIKEYPFNGHEGGQAFHEVERLRFLASLSRRGS